MDDRSGKGEFVRTEIPTHCGDDRGWHGRTQASDGWRPRNGQR